MNAIYSDTPLHGAMRRHAVVQTLVLHLAPGVLITFVFVVLAWLTRPLGWPASLALLVTWLIAGIPVLLAILFHQGKQLNGVLSLRGILQYREPLPVRQ